MKLLHTVVRFCLAHVRDASGRAAVTVPHDFRVTVPPSLDQKRAADAGTIAERPGMALRVASQNRNPTILAPQH